MAEPEKLRVSDEERERAAQEIREHFAAGRLSDDELADRLQAVYSAKTVEELQATRTDLPLLPAMVAAQQRAELAERRSQLQRRLFQEAGGGVIAFAVCSLIWLASGASGQFWPIWVALVCLLPLLRSGWLLYGPAPELDRVEQQLERRRRRERLGREREELRSELRRDAIARRAERRDEWRQRRRDRR
jgi:hypothetical protein